jgi:hypothetical protein
LRRSFNYVSRRAGAHDPADADVLNAWRKATRAYPWMLGLFAAGMLLFVLFGAASLWNLAHQHDALTVERGPGTLLVARRGACLWALDTVDQHARWALLAPTDKQPCPISPAERLSNARG